MPSKFFRSFLLVIGLFTSGMVVGASVPADSLGVERKGEKLLVLHRVEAGETLSALSRRYNSSVAAIREENNLTEDALKLGVVLKVPYTSPARTATVIPPGKKTHLVAAGQTLYSIAKLYNVGVEDLREWNSLTSNEISLGQELLVGDATSTVSAPSNTAAEEESAPGASPNPSAASTRKTHYVKPSQGLYSIARMYKVTVEDLRQWNKLTSDYLRPGQDLFVEAEPATASTATTVSPADSTLVVEEKVAASQAETKTVLTADTEAVPMEENIKKTAGDRNAEEKSDALIASARTETVTAPEPSYTIANAGGYEKKIETGLAENISSSQESEMFLALHRTAPVGTIIQVRNQMNDLSVFVKVIGKLPDTGANQKLIIKLSKKACERLAAIDKRFRVELSYMP